MTREVARPRSLDHLAGRRPRAGPPRIQVMVAIPDSVRAFLAGGLWAHVVTMTKQGDPHVNLCWAGLDGDDLVFASFFDARRVARLRRDPRVTLSFQAKGYEGRALFPYLVIDGHATVHEGGALDAMDHLVQWYLGPGARYPARDMPPGWTFRVSIDRIYGQGPWNDRWVEMDRASRDAP